MVVSIWLRLHPVAQFFILTFGLLGRGKPRSRVIGPVRMPVPGNRQKIPTILLQVTFPSDVSRGPQQKGGKM